MFRSRSFLLGACALGFLIACATSPLGRKQFIVVSDSEMSQMGSQAFQELKTQEKIDQDPVDNQYVKCIVDPLLKELPSQFAGTTWEVVVFQSKEPNAFALPGGKIGVYTGMLGVAKNQGQLAAVIGHEIGHVIARHGAERVSQEAGTQAGLAALGTITAGNPNGNTLMGLLGVGVQVGVLLPYGRTQESEADLIGLDLMAKAGFDPKQSVELWKNMIHVSGGQAPPEWLSTHPASENRISNLQAHMTDAMSEYETAKAARKTPTCSKAKK